MQLDIEFPDRLPYRVRRSTRAKRPSVSVCMHDGVVLTLPQRFDEKRVPALLAEWQPWIKRQVAQLEAHRADLPGEMTAVLPEKITLAACNGSWRVDYRQRSTGARALEKGDCLTVSSPADDPPAARRALRRWLSRNAREHLQGRLDELTKRHDFHYKRLSVRGQRTRWGSCSSTGTISLNYLLMFLAPELVDSVVLHELCHTRYMSHGPRFYSLVQRLEPRYAELDRGVREGWQAIPTWAWPR